MASSYPTSADSLARVTDGTTKVKGATPNPIMEAVEAAQEFVGESGASQAHNTDLIAQIFSLKPTIQLSFVDVATVRASAGVSRCQNAAGSVRKLRKNTSTTDITDANLDTGSAFSSNTAYLVFADADDGATTVGFIVTEAGSTPSTVTHYELIGGFSTDGSNNVLEESVWSLAGMRITQIKYEFETDKVETTTQIPADGTKPQYTEGVAVAALDVVPSSTTAKWLLIGIGFCESEAAQVVTGALFKNGATDADAIAAGATYGLTNETVAIVVMFIVVPGAVEKTEFAWRMGGSNASGIKVNSNSDAQIFGGVSQSGLIAIEFDV